MTLPGGTSPSMSKGRKWIVSQLTWIDLLANKNWRKLQLKTQCESNHSSSM